MGGVLNCPVKSLEPIDNLHVNWGCLDQLLANWGSLLAKCVNRSFTIVSPIDAKDRYVCVCAWMFVIILWVILWLQGELSLLI